MMMSYLHIRNIGRHFGSVAAVKGFDLSIGQGEFISLLGPSGCGKTTTLRMIAGFLTPTEGTILLDGKDITHMPPAGRNIGMVFQDYALFPHMTVRDNVAFGLKCRGVRDPELQQRVTEILRRVELGALEFRYPRELSGGQQQRVALARALVLKPALLIFDEPLSNLDAQLRVQMREEIHSLQRETGITAVFVTHDQEEALVLSDRIVVMKDGAIEQVGTPGDIYDNPGSLFIANFIGKANVIAGRIEAGRFVDRKGTTISLADNRRDAASVALMVRPEQIELTAEPADGMVRGTVVGCSLLGPIHELLVRTEAGDRVVVHLQRRLVSGESAVDQAVGLKWNPQHSRILADV